MAHPPNSRLAPFLTKLARRSALADADRAAVLALPGVAAQVRANEDFVSQGEPVDHACLVLEGLVGRFGQNERGDRQIMSLHIPGDMPDLRSVVMPDAGSGLQALTVTTVLNVPHSALRAAARCRPALAEAFWRECVADGAILAEWVLNVGRRRALARTAHLLCEMAWRSGRADDGDCDGFRFPATQTHLGDMLALTPVHVNRTVKALRDEQAASVERGFVRILDWARLAAIGEFDPAYLDAGRPEGAESRAA